MTNLEWFRTAPKEEIAEWLCMHRESCYKCPSSEHCHYDGFKIVNGFLKWMDEERKEN